MIPLTIAGETIKIKNAGMSYAFLMSLSNVTNTLNDMLGAWLYRFLSQPRLEWLFDKFYLSFADIAGSPAIRTMILQIFVYIGLLFTIVGTVFVYLLKKELDANNISVNLAASD